MFGNDYVDSLLCSILASEPGAEPARRAGSGCRGQVVEMLSYWERGIVTASLRAFWAGLTRQKGGEGRGGTTLEEIAIATSQLSAHIFL